MSLPILPPFILVSLVVFACCLISAGIGILLTRAQFKKRKLLKTRIIIALSVVGIVTFYFLFYTVSSLIGRSSVKAMWDKVEAAGIPVKPEQVIPRPPQKPSDNAVPFYKAATALLESTDIADRLFKLDKKYKKQYDIANWSEQDRTEALKISKEKNVQQALSFFSMGTRKPYAFNKREYKGLKTLLPQLRAYRELFRIISFSSNCYAYEGRLNEAYDLTIDGFKFIRQSRNDPSFIGQLVYIACTWINLRRVNSLVTQYGISNKKAQKLINTLNVIDYNQAMKKGINGELVLFGRDFYEKLAAGDMDYALFLSNNRKAFADLVYMYPFIYQDYARYVGYVLKTYKSFDKPFWETIPEVKSRQEAVASLFPLGAYISGSLPYARTKVARMNSITAATKIILALHIYKNKHGEFPEKLDILTPEILKEISVDPVTGKTLDYKKTGKYFQLTGFYSGEK